MLSIKTTIFDVKYVCYQHVKFTVLSACFKVCHTSDVQYMIDICFLICHTHMSPNSYLCHVLVFLGVLIHCVQCVVSSLSCMFTV